jgi:hypothetical protein
MVIREVERGGGVIVRAMKARQQEADRQRAKFAGPHYSSLVNDYVDQVYPRKYPELPDKQRVSLYELGDVIEELIADELRKRSGFEKPTPKRYKGVWFSPDGWSPASKTIDEVKGTRLSSAKVLRRPDGLIDGIEDSPKLLKHVLQLKGYMFVWQARRGRLHEMFLNGNWRPPFPDPRTFVLRPETSHELSDTVTQMLDHGNDRGLL